MSLFARKKQVIRELRDAGIAGIVDAKAIHLLAEYIEEQGRAEALQEVLNVCQEDGLQSGTVTVTEDSVKAAIAQLRGSHITADDVTVINAFEIPKISYDPVKRKMYTDNQPRSLLAYAQAKYRLYLDRLHLIHQRIRRNPLFQQKNVLLGATNDVATIELTDLQSLKGVVGQRKCVMGCISRSEDNRYSLEDNSACVPLDLSAAATASGYFTENCIVIAEGELGQDGAFHARALGLPPTESRHDLSMAAQKLNFFGGPELSGDALLTMQLQESGHLEDRIVVLSDVWLDKRAVLDNLHALFQGFQEAVEVPVMFVLMGNFHSRYGSSSSVADVDILELRDNFNSLAVLIDQYPRIKAESRFVFVPGQGDISPGGVLPQPALPPYLTAQLQKMLPNAVFSSNPCRLRYFSQEIVFFRYNILNRLRRRCLIQPADDQSSSTEANWGNLALTLLQQSHLCPLPLLQQPIYWEYDHALHLYPLPHAVVVADASPQAEYVHDGCNVWNPGSFSEGFFAAYLPCQQKVEMSEIPKDGQQLQSDDEDVPQEVTEQAAPRQVPQPRATVPATAAAGMPAAHAAQAAGGKQGRSSSKGVAAAAPRQQPLGPGRSRYPGKGQAPAASTLPKTPQGCSAPGAMCAEAAVADVAIGEGAVDMDQAPEPAWPAGADVAPADADAEHLLPAQHTSNGVQQLSVQHTGRSSQHKSAVMHEDAAAIAAVVETEDDVWVQVVLAPDTDVDMVHADMDVTHADVHMANADVGIV